MTKAERTRQFIIEQSAPTVNKKGVAGTSITDLMEVTNLTKGGIYSNFQNKQQVCLETFDYLDDAIHTGLDNAIVTNSTSKEKLYALLDYYRDYVATNQTGGCPLLNFGTEADDTNPAIKKRVAKAVKASQQRIQKLVEDGRANREFDKNLDSGLVALKIFTTIEGAMFTSRVTSSRATMKTVVDLLKKEIETL